MEKIKSIVLAFFVCVTLVSLAQAEVEWGPTDGVGFRDRACGAVMSLMCIRDANRLDAVQNKYVPPSPTVARAPARVPAQTRRLPQQPRRHIAAATGSLITCENQMPCTGNVGFFSAKGWALTKASLAGKNLPPISAKDIAYAKANETRIASMNPGQAASSGANFGITGEDILVGLASNGAGMACGPAGMVCSTIVCGILTSAILEEKDRKEGFRWSDSDRQKNNSAIFLDCSPLGMLMSIGNTLQSASQSKATAQAKTSAAATRRKPRN